MNPHSPTFNPAAEEQASLWAARLDGSVLTATDRAALDAWLAENPAHRDLLTSYCQFSADLEARLAQLSGSASVDLPASARSSSRVLRWTGGIALAAAAAVAVMLWANRSSSDALNNIVTPVAQRQSLTLSDGTRVDLNAQTTLRVDISGDHRHVTLSSGEAYFAVHKDPSRPFIVETPAGSVRVTGTHFDVRTDSASALEVTVAEGSVQVNPGESTGVTSTPQALVAGDQFSASPRGISRQHLGSAEVEDALAWRQGQIVFDRVPLRDALARFARYHGRTIAVAPGAAGLLVGGRYSLDDLDGFLASIEDVLPVHVVREANGTLQVGARSQR